MMEPPEDECKEENKENTVEEKRKVREKKLGREVVDNIKKGEGEIGGEGWGIGGEKGEQEFEKMEGGRENEGVENKHEESNELAELICLTLRLKSYKKN